MLINAALASTANTLLPPVLANLVTPIALSAQALPPTAQAASPAWYLMTATYVSFLATPAAPNVQVLLLTNAPSAMKMRL